MVRAGEGEPDSTEVRGGLGTSGVRYTGQTPDHTIRRGRTVYWPTAMSARTAITRYDQAHARRNSVGDERRPARTATGASAVPDTLGA